MYNPNKARNLTGAAQTAVAAMMPIRAHEMLGQPYYRERVAASLRALATAIEKNDVAAARLALVDGGLVNSTTEEWIFATSEENRQTEERYEARAKKEGEL